MKAFKKIGAFTITEMIIVIIISTIVAGLAFTVLNVVQKNMRSIESNYSKKTALIQLEQSLSIALNTYTEAHWDKQKEQLVLKSPIAATTFQFHTDSIVSELGTFPLHLHEKQFYFQGEIVQTGVVDALKLNFSEANDFHRIFVFQYNDATTNYDYSVKGSDGD